METAFAASFTWLWLSWDYRPHHHRVENLPQRRLPVPGHPSSPQAQGLIGTLSSILDPALTPKGGPTSDARSPLRRLSSLYIDGGSVLYLTDPWETEVLRTSAPPFLTAQGGSRRPPECLIWAHSGGSSQGLSFPNSTTPGLVGGWGVELSGGLMRVCGDIMFNICMPGIAPNVTATGIQGLVRRR